MNRRNICRLFLAMAIPVFLFGCGGDGGSGSSSSTGTVSMDITDTKPMLPLDVEQVIIRFDAVSVHKAGGGWLVLPLAEEAQTPYEIDLLQFTDGNTTQFVPPTQLEPGHYTQIRIEVIDAEMIPLGGGKPIPLIISSNDVKTDKQFDFDVTGGGAVAVVIDFDLSQSIVATGDGTGDVTYKLKPVLHLNEAQEAATIRGKISEVSFGGLGEARVTVTWDKEADGILNPDEDEVYTTVVTEEESDPTDFSIFWLVPEKGYHVDIKVDGTVIYEEFVPSSELSVGAIFC
ncbi:MAG: DUF4382 domain-containing protein [Proteobacteria bacterium]|nr:DUF4382 domain-containing protein [Pseudomonadota bacterium]